MNTVTVREGYLTRRQLAAHYAVSQRTVQTWTAEGMPHHGPDWGMSRTIRYLLSESDAWLEQRESADLVGTIPSTVGSLSQGARRERKGIDA